MKVENTLNKKMSFNVARFVKRDGELFLAELDPKTGEIVEYPFIETLMMNFEPQEYLNMVFTSKDIIDD